MITSTMSVNDSHVLLEDLCVFTIRFSAKVSFGALASYFLKLICFFLILAEGRGVATNSFEQFLIGRSLCTVCDCKQSGKKKKKKKKKTPILVPSRGVYFCHAIRYPLLALRVVSPLLEFRTVTAEFVYTPCHPVRLFLFYFTLRIMIAVV